MAHNLKRVALEAKTDPRLKASLCGRASYQASGSVTGSTNLDWGNASMTWPRGLIDSRISFGNRWTGKRRQHAPRENSDFGVNHRSYKQ